MQWVAVHLNMTVKSYCIWEEKRVSLYIVLVQIESRRSAAWGRRGAVDKAPVLQLLVVGSIAGQGITLVI